MIILSLAFATCLAGASHAAGVDRLYAVSFNGSLYPPGTGLVNGSGNVSGNIYLYAIDPAGGNVLWNLLLNESAYYIVASPADGQLFPTSGFSKNVTLIDPVHRARAGVFSINGSASGLAISPDGSLLYVAVPDRQAIYALRATDGVVSMVIPVNNTPYGLTLSPDGRRIYAVDSRNDSVTVVDVPGRRQVAELMTGARPADVAVSPDGGTAFVANYGDDTISVFNTKNYTLKQVISDVIKPTYLVTDIAQSWVFAAFFTDGNLTQIDAATSRAIAVKPIGIAGLGRPVVSSDSIKIFVPEWRRNILNLNAATLGSPATFNFTTRYRQWPRSLYPSRKSSLRLCPHTR
jgi:YVTN family beta-propeller protein